MNEQELIIHELNEIFRRYKDEKIRYSIELGTSEIPDDEGFSKFCDNGTATILITINGGATHDGRI